MSVAQNRPELIPVDQHTALVAILPDAARDHFHLHANRGLSDEHLSFVEAEWLEICGIDDYTTPWNTFEALSVLDNTFPTARKVLEVPPFEAREDLQRIIEAVTRIRRQDALISA